MIEKYFFRLKEKFLSWQGRKRRELFLSCCDFDSYISFVGKILLSAFGTIDSSDSKTNNSNNRHPDQ